MWRAFVGFVTPFLFLARAMAADNCPGSSSEIATDRPDVTNSSLVVPVGSLQSENGVDLISGGGARALDGTNTRLRVGVSPCLEFLVDLPSYSAGVQGPADWGFSNLSPAIKWQISPLPGKFDLSVTAGVGLPTGASRISGPGAQPYLQFPWSLELSDDWAVNGMVTQFFRPSDPANKLLSQYTFVLERKLGRQTDLFVEYVANVGSGGSTSQLINSGLAYRITPTQQVDFHVAFGLDPSAPNWIVGVGYSFRLDHLFSANK
jgi:Putative MetA-pathway of phenol degradation